MRRGQRWRFNAVIAAALACIEGGCASLTGGADGIDSKVPVTKSELPSAVQPYSRIEETLQCIASTASGIYGTCLQSGPASTAGCPDEDECKRPVCFPTGNLPHDYLFPEHYMPE